MSTDFYRFKAPFTSARTKVGGGHTQLSLWVNHAKAGELTLRNEEVGDVLHALKRDDPALTRHGTVLGETELRFHDDDVDAGDILISDCGELFTIAEKQAKELYVISVDEPVKAEGQNA